MLEGVGLFVHNALEEDPTSSSAKSRDETDGSSENRLGRCCEDPGPEESSGEVPNKDIGCRQRVAAFSLQGSYAVQRVCVVACAS